MTHTHGDDERMGEDALRAHAVEAHHDEDVLHITTLVAGGPLPELLEAHLVVHGAPVDKAAIVREDLAHRLEQAALVLPEGYPTAEEVIARLATATKLVQSRPWMRGRMSVNAAGTAYQLAGLCTLLVNRKLISQAELDYYERLATLESMEEAELASRIAPAGYSGPKPKLVGLGGGPLGA